MKLHAHDIPLVLFHLPQALHDLMHHENADMVNAAFAKLYPQIAKTAPPESNAEKPAAPAVISIEKSLDPLVQRSVQNIGLLLHDYVGQLATFDVSNAEGDALLEHWRNILVEQPPRLATSQMSHWHEGKTKAFWQEKLALHAKKYGISPDILTDAWNDWQRASGAIEKGEHMQHLQKMEHRQWQDLVMRARLHHETEKYHMGKTPTLMPYF